jgi:hypothetical protein
VAKIAQKIVLLRSEKQAALKHNHFFRAQKVAKIAQNWSP